jgi:hypothetical protein
VKTFVQGGWPHSKRYLPIEATTSYFDNHDKLVWGDGLLLRGDRVVVATSLRREPMQELHKFGFKFLVGDSVPVIDVRGRCFLGGAVESLLEFLWRIVMKLLEFNLFSDKSV